MTLRRGRDDRGAAAVEFALVVPVLLMVMLGILDYGMWFSDSLNLRQGAREGARSAVVDDASVSTGCTGQVGLALVACNTRVQIGAVGGTSYARVAIFNPDGTASTDWKKGQQLLVCGVVKETALTGLTPLPSDGMLRSSVRMRIENGTHTYSTHQDTLPNGQTWSWCTP
jgi:Flp pilus assembly pilin Flp